MYNYQGSKHEEKFGGYRVVFTGVNRNLASGRFTCSPDRFPDIKNGYIPAGTPIFIDEENRTFDIHFAFKVYEAATATATSVKIAKDAWSGSRIQTGMVLMIAPDAIDGDDTAVTVTAVDRSEADYDTLTLATGGLGTAVTTSTILVEAESAGSDKTIKVEPNALLPYDLPKDPYSTIIWADGCFNLLDGVVLENRIPPIVDAVKEYMRSQDCYFRYSKSEE